MEEREVIIDNVVLRLNQNEDIVSLDEFDGSYEEEKKDE